VTKIIDDIVLSVLLELDGEVFPMDNGFWTKFSVKKVEPNEHIPHGTAVPLTLFPSFRRRPESGRSLNQK